MERHVKRNSCIISKITVADDKFPKCFKINDILNKYYYLISCHLPDIFETYFAIITLLIFLIRFNLQASFSI